MYKGGSETDAGRAGVMDSPGYLAQDRIRVRDSNMELMRIVAMCLILIHHFLTHGSPLGGYRPPSAMFAWPFFLDGVNLFFLLSGWYLIRLSVKGFLRLFMTVFAFVQLNSLGCFLIDKPLTGQDLLFTFIAPLSTQNWFIDVYFGLMLASPIINKGLTALTLNQLKAIVLIFTLFTIYSGNIGHNACNENGYTFFQGIYMYTLGYWLRRDTCVSERVTKAHCLALCVCLTALDGILSVALRDSPVYIRNLTAYNNLFIVGASVFLFLYFTKLRFHSKAVNRLAAYSLGCYLLQDGCFGDLFLYPASRHWTATLPAWRYVSLFAALFISFWVASGIITNVLNRVIHFVNRSLPTRLAELKFK